MSQPKVTVLLPVYNGERYIAETIQSVLNQSFSDFELLIINDGSTDNTKSIVHGFADSRIRIIDNDVNRKLIATLNRGLNLAQGEYIARIDADDACLPNRLNLQVNFLDQHPDYGMVGGGMNVFREYNKSIRFRKARQGYEELKCQLLLQNTFNHPTVMIRRSVLEKYDLKYENFPHAEDYDLWIRLTEKAPCDNLSEALILYRHHEDQVSNKYNTVQAESVKTIHRRLFDQLSLPYDDKLIELHYRIFIQQPVYSLNFAEEVYHHFENLIEANSRQEIYNPIILKRILSREWFMTCTTLASQGVAVHRLYYNSKLREAWHPGKRNLFRFWIKSLLRKEK